MCERLGQCNFAQRIGFFGIINIYALIGTLLFKARRNFSSQTLLADDVWRENVNTGEEALLFHLTTSFPPFLGLNKVFTIRLKLDVGERGANVRALLTSLCRKLRPFILSVLGLYSTFSEWNTFRTLKTSFTLIETKSRRVVNLFAKQSNLQLTTKVNKTLAFLL